MLKDAGITKVVTIEASELLQRFIQQTHLGFRWQIFMVDEIKEHHDERRHPYCWSLLIYKQVSNTVSIASKYLSQQDKVLIVDDPLARTDKPPANREIGRTSWRESGSHWNRDWKSFQDGRGL